MINQQISSFLTPVAAAPSLTLPGYTPGMPAAVIPPQIPTPQASPLAPLPQYSSNQQAQAPAQGSGLGTQDQGAGTKYIKQLIQSLFNGSQISGGGDFADSSLPDMFA